MDRPPRIFALVDINNCYVSCERVFNPSLNNRPVILLSNNDGCAVARSQEAKDLGIKMAVPYYQIKELVEQHQVEVLSSNYALYAEMSRRFMKILGEFVEPNEREIYSIDECFLNLSSHAALYDLNQFAQSIRNRVWQWLGLPICIGIGRTKTEAKMANHLAKKHQHFNGVCNLIEMDPCALELLYQQTDISEVWGVGRRQREKLNQMNIYSVLDLALTSPEMIRKRFSVVLQRTVLELQGIPCIELEHQPEARKQIVSSRSFGHRVTELNDLKEAMSLYIQDAVIRLRQDRLLCGCVIAFVQSNPFDKQQAYYNQSLSFALPEPTDHLLTLSKIVVSMVDQLYQKDIVFKKCGVILTCLEPKAKHTYDIFTDMQQVQKENQLMTSLEKIQSKFGRSKLGLGASMLPYRHWNMSRDRLSQNYFQWDSLLEIK
ncbi:DNA-directed DNA polymerase [Acinetobacter sp. LoGeW2-3]|uniref:Y-family DNA polymerase n=1 Tax=Acinetobacter sp. LoGeW2-3 TaxID=1808001 RepID=UPI000C05969D|nr:Y-family DNA polymerase [Acinetobacter sp. LoGeW2-3]ATO19579.1 DNA-directed DNA polymerase [Acinetobacter sp. LoGeW2-3]